MVFNSLHFVWFFVVVYAPLPRAAAPGAELAAARRELLLLRGVGLALPRRCSSPRRSSTTRCALVHRPRRTTPRAPARAARRSASASTWRCSASSSTSTSSPTASTALFDGLGWQVDFVTLRVLLPIGISFYTFVTMSYVIDVYRREIPPTRDLARLRGVRRLLPAPRRRTDPARVDAAAADRRAAARSRAEQMRDGRLADRVGLLPEDLRRRQPRAASPTASSIRPPRIRPASTSCSASTRSRSRSTATSPATRTSRAAPRS